MVVGQTLMPFEGMDMDTDPAFIKNTKARFLKNVGLSIINKEGSTTKEGPNEYSYTPLLRNQLYENQITVAGENICIGGYDHKNQNQCYVFVWNSTKQHFIYRISGALGSCALVYKGPALDFVLDPTNFIGVGRVTVQVTTRLNPITNLQEDITYIMWTKNVGDQNFLCVEDSMRTNSFDKVAFPYFNCPDSFFLPDYYIRLGVVPPQDCIGITGIPRYTPDMSPEQIETERNQPNLIDGRSLQWRIRFIDVWGRPSEYGPVSDQWINSLGGLCNGGGESTPRGVTLEFNCASPIHDMVEILVRENKSNTRGLPTTTDWYLYDTISKYNNETGKFWYERDFNSEVKYDSTTNTIKYDFYNNKEWVPVDYNSTNRLQNPIPLTSGTLFPLNRRIGLGRNVRNYGPISEDELKKATYTVTPATPDACGLEKSYNLKIWGIIYNPYDETWLPLRNTEGYNVFGTADCYGNGGASGAAKAWGDAVSAAASAASVGAITAALALTISLVGLALVVLYAAYELLTGRENNPFHYGQVLPKGQEGIIGYLAGTDNYAISKQYLYSRHDQSKVYQGIPINVPGGPMNIGNYVGMQLWEFPNMPPGKYIFRVASHQAQPTDNYAITSTRVIGRTDVNNLGNLPFGFETEIEVEITDADVELFSNPLMIYDLSRIGKGCTVVNRTAVCEGYLYEDETGTVPVERAYLSVGFSSAVRPDYTDHNGYYFAASERSGWNVKFYGWKQCVANQLIATSKTVSNADYAMQLLYAYQGLQQYPIRDRYYVKGKMVTCGEDPLPIPGALVILTNGSYGFTDSFGQFSIAAHNNGNLSSARIENLVISQRGGCVLLSCNDNCEYSIPDIPVVSPDCNGDNERDVTVADVLMQYKNSNQFGPQMGGKYYIALLTEDWMGRQRFAQCLESHFVNIPPIQKTGTYNYSIINFDISQVNFPADVRKVSFAVTQNQNFNDFLSWVAEKIEFVDSTGAVNNASPTAIRLYYRSLAEYNTQNNFSTNTSWQILTAANAPVQGDQVEFIAYGDGTLFTQRIVKSVQYDKEGTYLQVEYDDVLKGLTAGSLIKLLRPARVADNQWFYELCPQIRVINGKALVGTGTINIEDSYMITRRIPVPVDTQVITTVNGNQVITTQTNVILKSYSFPFESPSPSDFWGDHAWNKGRITAKNPQEKQVLIRKELAGSDELSVAGSFNGLGYFEAANVIQYDEHDGDAINVCISQERSLFVLCENKNFIVGFNDNLVRLNEAGVAFADNSKLFGTPQPISGGKYGCQLFDYNTIRINKNGIVGFLDTINNALVRYDGASVADVSMFGAKGWLTSKIKFIRANNNDPNNRLRYFIGGIDEKKHEYLLTDTYLHKQDIEFINDLRGPDTSVNETLAFDLIKMQVRQMYSFVPEYYMQMSDLYDDQLITFYRGAAWFHYNANISNPSFNNFYGIVVDKVFEVIMNTSRDASKNFETLRAMVREHVLYCDKIFTESQQQSRIMPKWFDYIVKYFSADFKCATNTYPDPTIPITTGNEVITDGDKLYGRWLSARFVGKKSDREKYFSLSGFEIFFNVENKPEVLE